MPNDCAPMGERRGTQRGWRFRRNPVSIGGCGMDSWSRAEERWGCGYLKVFATWEEISKNIDRKNEYTPSSVTEQPEVLCGTLW